MVINSFVSKIQIFFYISSSVHVLYPFRQLIMTHNQEYELDFGSFFNFTDYQDSEVKS